MTNSWLKLPDRPDYVLPSEKDAITAHNRKAKLEYKIWPNLYPVPYAGNVAKAKVIFLQLNPGVEIPPGFDRPIDEDEEFPELLRAEQKNIRQEKMEYPFIYLDPKLRFTGGFRYWTKKFSAIIRTERDYVRLANRLACIEFFPYHSNNYLPLKQVLPSQKYGFSLVRAAIKRKAKIIVMRGKDKWLKAVPELKGHCYVLKSARNVVISENNMKPKEFKELCKILHG